MSELTRITPAQEELLRGFTCQRLTDEKDNLHLAWEFLSRRNKSLEETLKFEAWQEDLEGVPAAYYVVKAPSGRIALYFSLKCGTLCDPTYAAKLTQSYNNVQQVLEELGQIGTRDEAFEYLEEVRTSGMFPMPMSRRELMDHFREVKQDKQWLKKEKKAEPSDKIVRVDMAFPAVELVHFCVNDRVRDEWKKLGLGHAMGETLFWQFVLPKMLEISTLAGCEYAYLFAADSSRDSTLIKYYEKVLHFECSTTLGGIKPQYDFLCTFMCKRLRRLSTNRKMYVDPKLWENEDSMSLEDYRNEFFENFNK